MEVIDYFNTKEKKSTTNSNTNTDTNTNNNNNQQGTKWYVITVGVSIELHYLNKF